MINSPDAGSSQMNETGRKNSEEQPKRNTIFF